jgi:hypothetical protein
MGFSYSVVEMDEKWATLEGYQRERIKIPRLWLPSQCEAGCQVLAEVKLSDGRGMVEFAVVRLS